MTPALEPLKNMKLAAGGFHNFVLGTCRPLPHCRGGTLVRKSRWGGLSTGDMIRRGKRVRGSAADAGSSMPEEGNLGSGLLDSSDGSSSAQVGGCLAAVCSEECGQMD